MWPLAWRPIWFPWRFHIMIAGSSINPSIHPSIRPLIHPPGEAGLDLPPASKAARASEPKSCLPCHAQFSMWVLRLSSFGWWISSPNEQPTNEARAVPPWDFNSRGKRQALAHNSTPTPLSNSNFRGRPLPTGTPDPDMAIIQQLLVAAAAATTEVAVTVLL